MVWETILHDGALMVNEQMLCANVHMQVAANLPPVGEEPWSAPRSHYSRSVATTSLVTAACRSMRGQELDMRRIRPHGPDPGWPSVARESGSPLARQKPSKKRRVGAKESSS